MLNSFLPLGVTDVWELFANSHSYFLIVWRWSIFPLRWPALQGSRFFFMLSGTLLVSRTRWFLPCQYLWAFFINTFQVDGPAPFALIPNRPSCISYPVPDISVTSSFVVGRGVSQRRWKMIELVLSLLGILRRNGPPLDGVAVGTRTWRVSRDTKQSSPTLVAQLWTATILFCEGQELVGRKLTKAKINLF